MGLFDDLGQLGNGINSTLFGHGSELSKLGGDFTAGLQNVSKFLGLNPDRPPDPLAPPPPPKLADATTTALQNQLSQERQMRASSLLFTGGGGLSDSPMTASRSLLGS